MIITQRLFLISCKLNIADIASILGVSRKMSKSFFDEKRLFDVEQIGKILSHAKTDLFEHYAGRVGDLWFIIKSHFRINNMNMKPLLISNSGIILYWNKPTQSAVIMQDKEVLDVWESVGVRPITAQKRFKALYK